MVYYNFITTKLVIFLAYLKFITNFATVFTGPARN